MMRWCSRHAPLAFVLSIVLGLVSGLAWAQGLTEPVQVDQVGTLDPGTVALLQLFQAGAVPGAAGVAAWLLRGVLAQGIPVRIHLSQDDRLVLRELSAQRGETTDPGGPR